MVNLLFMLFLFILHRKAKNRPFRLHVHALIQSAPGPSGSVMRPFESTSSTEVFQYNLQELDQFLIKWLTFWMF
jgi:hypothetical protein